VKCGAVRVALVSHRHVWLEREQESLEAFVHIRHESRSTRIGRLAVLTKLRFLMALRGQAWVIGLNLVETSISLLAAIYAFMSRTETLF
jgi:hypothetical protein